MKLITTLLQKKSFTFLTCERCLGNDYCESVQMLKVSYL